MGFRGDMRQLIRLCSAITAKGSAVQEKTHTLDISKILQTLWHQPMGQQVQIRTLPALLYQRENNLGKNLGSVPECNKRCVLCTIKFEVFCAVCIVNQYSTLLKICIPYPAQWQITIVLHGWLEKRYPICYVQGKLLQDL